MEVIIKSDSDSVGRLAAGVVASVIREKPEAVLGLATGSTVLPLYQELVRMHREEELDFSRVTTFNLDEYVGLAPDHPSSYDSFMREHLFRHINVAPDQVHIPDGLASDIPAECREYERRIREAGGVDLQVLGIGRDGHIGFNEPTSSLASRTRIKTLTRQTLLDNARFFGGSQEVPRHVITMGIGTILESRQCLLMAFGESKAEAAAAAIEGPVTSSCPASVLQFHEKVMFMMDPPAAASLRNTDYYRWVYDGKPDWQSFE